MNESAETSRKRFRSLALVEIDPKDLFPAEVIPREIRNFSKAADVVDELFWRQVSPEVDASSLLALAKEDRELQEMVLFHCGPYDRLNNNSPFLAVNPKAPGAGFYPPDLTAEEFTAYLQCHPDCRYSFESPYTVITRMDNRRLAAVPYHEAFQDLVSSLSSILGEASRTEKDPHLREFLAQRGKDLRTDDYSCSDALWVRLADNPVDLVVGPYEVYEDQLMGLKAAYEAMVLGRDFVETGKIQHFQHELPSLRRSLEGEVGKKLNVESSQVALSVANLIYGGGDARKAIPAIAFSLPNDERTIEEVGSRQVILRNVLEAKFRLVNWQLHKRLLQTSLDDEEAAFRCFFDHTLFHEISHPIGPHRITRNGEETTVNRSLKQHYSVLEETKADTLAACFILQMAGELGARTFLETYVPGFLRAIRFGLNSAHAGANAIQFNFLLQEGAIEVDAKAGRISVNEEKARRALTLLVSSVIAIQERGDFEAAHRFVADFCILSPEISILTARVSDLPVDIRIRFKINREHAPEDSC